MPPDVSIPIAGVVTVAIATVVVTVVINPIIYTIILSSTVEIVIVVGMT